MDQFTSGIEDAPPSKQRTDFRVPLPAPAPSPAVTSLITSPLSGSFTIEIGDCSVLSL